MTDVVFSRRLQELIEQVRNHPNRDEILTLALEQQADDMEEVGIGKDM